MTHLRPTHRRSFARAVRSLSSAACVAACLGAVGCGSAVEGQAGEEPELGAAELAVAVPGKYGFLWADQPTNADYPPHASFTYNSAGLANRVVRNSKGSYTANFPGLGGTGIPHVTAYGSDNVKCKAASWGGAVNMGVNVVCHTPAGDRADSRFVVSFFQPASDDAGAFVFAGGGVLIPSVQWNSTGAQNTVRKDGTGHFVVNLPFQTQVRSNVQVTAHGSNSNYCKVEKWFAFDPFSELVDVRCSDTTGAPADTNFVLSLVQIIPVASHIGAYAWADQPGNASYPAPSNWSWNSTFQGNVAERSDKGLYAMVHAGMPNGSSAVNVTAYGPGSEYCKLNGWGSNGAGGTRVSIRCFNASGAPTDTQYSERFLQKNAL